MIHPIPDYFIKDVGINFTSLVNDYGSITGQCIIYGIEYGDTETEDVRGFAFNPDRNEVYISHEIVNDLFSDEEYALAEKILLENILANKEVFDLNTKELKEVK